MNQENHPENKELKPVYMAPPEWYQPMQEDDEIDLVSLIGVLWRRKKMIAGIALGMAVLAAIVVFFVMTPRYKVSALVSPGIIGFNEDGTPIPASSLSDLQQWLVNGGYIDNMLLRLPPDAIALGLIPKPETIDTNFARDGKIMSVNLFTPEPDKGKDALQTIFDIMAESQRTYAYAKKNLEKNIADIDQQLENWDIQQTRHFVAIKKAEQEIDLLKKDLETLHKSIEAQKNIAVRLEQQAAEVHANTESIKKQRNNIVDIKGNELTLLMYSNIIQQNIDYAIQLEGRRDEIEAAILDKQQQYKIRQLEIKNKGFELADLKENKARLLEQARKELASQSELLKSQFALLTPLRIEQKPISSDEPVKPDKQKIIALAAVMGVFLGIMMAFLVEFYVRNKEGLNEL
jgi:LPS O-antigen subunit length determinant protein (WzzB/FepE family)